MFRVIKYLFIVLAMAAVVLLGIGAYNNGFMALIFPPDKPPTLTFRPTVEQVKSIAELGVTRIHVADIIEGEGYGFKGSWLVRGDATLTVNLDTAKISEVDESKKRATLLLEEPRVQTARVDMNRTRTWDVQRSSWTTIFTGGDQKRLTDTALAGAQLALEREASREHYINQAKVQGQSIVANMYRMVGWDVEVRWKKPGENTPPVPESK
jgi:rRNA maturation endonuclease Nob1